MVFSGIVWKVWYCLEGLVLSGIVWKVWNCLVFYGIFWYCLEGLVLSGILWYFMVLSGSTKPAMSDLQTKVVSLIM